MRVYILNVSSIDPADKKWYPLLSPRRAEKVNRLIPTQKKAQSIGVELLLRNAVKDETGEGGIVNWDTDQNGKLYLTEHPEIHVNLSHSGSYAVCVISDKPVGIDIQHCKPYDGMITHFLHPDEIAYIENNEDPATAFYEVWTKKESLFKACGKGITAGLDTVSVLSGTVLYDGKRYAFREYTLFDDYKLFVCFES